MKFRYQFLIFLSIAMILGFIEEYKEGIKSEEWDRSVKTRSREKKTSHIYNDILGNPVDEYGNPVEIELTKEQQRIRKELYDRFEYYNKEANYNKEELKDLIKEVLEEVDIEDLDPNDPIYEYYRDNYY